MHVARVSASHQSKINTIHSLNMLFRQREDPRLPRSNVDSLKDGEQSQGPLHVVRYYPRRRFPFPVPASTPVNHAFFLQEFPLISSNNSANLNEATEISMARIDMIPAEMRTTVFLPFAGIERHQSDCAPRCPIIRAAGSIFPTSGRQ